MNTFFNQAPFQCRLDWGLRGMKEAAKRKDIIILVDVLSFSSIVTTAIHYGAYVYPFEKNSDPNRFRRIVGAELIYSRADGSRTGRPSFSLNSLNKSISNKRFVLPSTNGSTCAKLCGKVPALLIGCFLNAKEVAKVAKKIQVKTKSNITVIACGERWRKNKEKDSRDELRPCIEDYLGAGAILSFLRGSKSPESIVCLNAFNGSKSKLRALIYESSSGRELRQLGFNEDVHYCSKLNYLRDVPILVQKPSGSYFKLYPQTKMAI